MGPVEKMALLVATEGNKVSQGATARDCTPGSHVLSEKLRGKEARRQRYSSSVEFCPVILPCSIQQDGVFALTEEARTQDDPASTGWTPPQAGRQHDRKRVNEVQIFQVAQPP